MNPKIDKVEGIRDIPSNYSKYYVVLRSGRRVSDTNHLTEDEARTEKEYWNNILQQWPDGTKLEIYTCSNVNFKP